MRIVIAEQVTVEEKYKKLKRIIGAGTIRYCRYQEKQIMFAITDSNMADRLRRSRVIVGGQMLKVEFRPVVDIDIQCFKCP